MSILFLCNCKKYFAYTKKNSEYWQIITHMHNIVPQNCAEQATGMHMAAWEGWELGAGESGFRIPCFRVGVRRRGRSRSCA